MQEGFVVDLSLAYVVDSEGFLVVEGVGCLKEGCD